MFLSRKTLGVRVRGIVVEYAASISHTGAIILRVKFSKVNCVQDVALKFFVCRGDGTVLVDLVFGVLGDSCLLFRVGRQIRLLLLEGCHGRC